jgi:hypothetical protein
MACPGRQLLNAPTQAGKRGCRLPILGRARACPPRPQPPRTSARGRGSSSPKPTAVSPARYAGATYRAVHQALTADRKEPSNTMPVADLCAGAACPRGYSRRCACSLAHTNRQRWHKQTRHRRPPLPTWSASSTPRPMPSVCAKPSVPSAMSEPRTRSEHTMPTAGGIRTGACIRRACVLTWAIAAAGPKNVSRTLPATHGDQPCPRTELTHSRHGDLVVAVGVDPNCACTSTCSPTNTRPSASPFTSAHG